MNDSLATSGTSRSRRRDQDTVTQGYDDTGTDRSVSFTCDALDRRVAFTNDHLDTTTRHCYGGPNEVLEFDPTALAAYYVHGPATWTSG